MATVSKDEKSGNFHVRFRFGGRSFKRSLKTGNAREALSVLGRVDETLRLLERGSIQMPVVADPVSFIISGGQRDAKPTATSLLTVHELFQLYRKSLPEGAKEKSTLKTERIHMAILVAFWKAKLTFAQ